jgi:hypothetical protein
MEDLRWPQMINLNVKNVECLRNMVVGVQIITKEYLR